MKFLLDQLEAMKPLFTKGGKLEKLYPLYEAGDTFVFTPADTTRGPTHVRDAIDLKRVMITVVIALLPAFLFGVYNAGHESLRVSQMPDTGFVASMVKGLFIVMPIVIVSYTVGGIWEVLFCVVRKHEVNEGFLVTGLLVPLVLPPTIPLWQVAAGVSFGVVIGKEIFGGTGFNILNPALTARAYLFFAHPKEMSAEVWTVFEKTAENGGETLAGWSGATPLAVASAAGNGGSSVCIDAMAAKGYTLQSMFLGFEGGSIGETGIIPIAVGLVILMLTGLASMRIIVGGMVGLVLGALFLNVIHAINPAGTSSFLALPFWYHFVMGGFFFGVVFMATDPVSAAATDTGKWIYGVLIGFLTVLIRLINPAYPEGVMLSILFMNVMAPLIDYYVVKAHLRRRVNRIRNFSYGH